jgi:proteasome lid subunit RPN8/RPN11
MSPPKDLLSHLESEYPREGCGVLLQDERTGKYRVRPMRNARAAPHARTAFAFDPGEWLTLLVESEARGERLACIYHSHTDTSAHFSAEDREWAAPDGEPLWPGVSYLVVSVERGRATEARGFAWKSGDFRETEGSPWAFKIEKPF